METINLQWYQYAEVCDLPSVGTKERQWERGGKNVGKKTMQLKIRESKADNKRKQGQIRANTENVELLSKKLYILLCIYLPIISCPSILGQLLGEENKR